MKKIIVILSIVCIVAMESCNQDTVLENMSLQDIESVNYICPFPISVLFALSKSGDIVGMDDAYYVGKGVAASALGLIQKYFDRSVALSNLGWSLYRQGKRNRYSLAVDRGLSAPGCTMDAYYDSSRRTIFFKTLLTTPANERVVLHEVLHLFQCEIGSVRYTDKNVAHTEFEVWVVYDILRCLEAGELLDQLEGGTSSGYRAFINDLAFKSYSKKQEEYVLEKFYRFKIEVQFPPFVLAA